jgi:hypothetical protein
VEGPEARLRLAGTGLLRAAACARRGRDAAATGALRRARAGRVWPVWLSHSDSETGHAPRRAIPPATSPR